MTAVGDDYFEGYCRRNNPIKRESCGIVQLGRKQFTEVALLARVPNEYIAAAQITNQDERIGHQIDEAYRLMEEDEDCEEWLKNPTLLIDFVNGDSDQLPFIQISFYWHGHSQESFFRAVVNPNPNRPSVIAPVAKCLNKQGYASLTYLHRCFAEQVDKKEFKEELDMACRQPNPQISKVTDNDAKTAKLSNEVYYSTEWMDEQVQLNDFSKGEIIGWDLYLRIITGNRPWRWDRNQPYGGNIWTEADGDDKRPWNWYNRQLGQYRPTRILGTDSGYLKLQPVRDAGYENVIPHNKDHNGRDYNLSNWKPFWGHYHDKEKMLRRR